VLSSGRSWTRAWSARVFNFAQTPRATPAYAALSGDMAYGVKGARQRPLAHDRISPPRGGQPHYQWMLNYIKEYALCLAFGST
jgi:hypothetical protein